MKEIEIIIIDDYSIDNTIKIIEDFMKDDPRIRLIKNNKNMKILYSKSIGALNANGEYIMQLDQDDMFIREDVFDILYIQAKKYDLDLVQISDLINNSFNIDKKARIYIFGSHLIYPKKTHYKTHPELKDKLFIDNNNYLLWGLLIRTNLYKKAIYQLWPLIMNYQIIFNEDYIATFMIILLAKNYKYINKFALMHLLHKKSISNDFWKKKEYYLSFYFYVQYLYKSHIKNNPQDIRIILNYINTNYFLFSKGKKFYQNFFYDTIRYILNSDYLFFMEKNEFLRKIKIYINKYNLLKSYKNVMNSTEFQNIIKYQNLNKNMKNYPNKKRKFDNKKIQLTIILFCFGSKYFYKTINSIVNQININYEIIIIYDNNEKKQLNSIKKYAYNFENIKIIDNKQQKGFLYSYSKGVINSKGDYILIMHSGYTLSKENILSSLYDIAITNNLDILEFNLLINNHDIIKNNNLNIYKCLHYESNIDLQSLKNNKNYKGVEQENEILFNKLIRANIYHDIIYKYKLNEYNITIFNYFENIFFFLLNKNEYIFKKISENGIIQNSNDIDISLKRIINDKYQIISDAIFYINFIFDNSDNTFIAKKNVLYEYINILSIIYNKFSLITKNSIKLLDKFLNSKYITNEDKNELKFLYSCLIN
jgi:glycosyltransferase involved in cell wall biosynthesis